jgi:sensor histidine kinase YesM
MERKKKLFEKELEVSRLSELKTKAELDALHARINPHFLYNALNSIADLSVTDGKKAREMTMSLADLFRYSINYTNSNFATVEEELNICRLYLQIEKIRFGDQLVYSVQAEKNTLNQPVPKFLLQPVLENAVKHGLKVTGRITEIKIEVMNEIDTLVIKVYDNGPPFPRQLNPGYGLKSIFDKLDLLFPGRFELKMHNEPLKHLELRLDKSETHEPAH